MKIRSELLLAMASFALVLLRPAQAQTASPAPPAEADAAEDAEPHDHMLELPGGGPTLNIRGFADFNLGLGRDSNPLIFPLGAPAHNSFQIGEVDLFLSSKLASKVSFLSEIVFAADATNNWGLDIERLQLTYKVNPYFQIGGGRYHTAIGYYNTAFHHGTWFQTAAGRPFMYFFEDSGGILPVHSVGVTATGLVPGTDKLGLHWIAEVGNGRSSNPQGQPVQNFLSDKNLKAFNLATYVKPDLLPGVQIGGSFYHDVMLPAGFPHVTQTVGSFYVVYSHGPWESLNEGVLLTNTVAAGTSYHTPLTYAQISHRFGRYRPYFRYQYVNSPAHDPVNIFTGRYQGPSLGLRMDFTEFVALKIQYNRLYQRDTPAENGVDLQAAFTF